LCISERLEDSFNFDVKISEKFTTIMARHKSGTNKRDLFSRRGNAIN
jgi:hypothetical protein